MATKAKKAVPKEVSNAARIVSNYSRQQKMAQAVTTAKSSFASGATGQAVNHPVAVAASKAVEDRYTGKARKVTPVLRMSDADLGNPDAPAIPLDVASPEQKEAFGEARIAAIKSNPAAQVSGAKEANPFMLDETTKAKVAEKARRNAAMNAAYTKSDEEISREHAVDDILFASPDAARKAFESERDWESRTDDMRKSIIEEMDRKSTADKLAVVAKQRPLSESEKKEALALHNTAKAKQNVGEKMFGEPDKDYAKRLSAEMLKLGKQEEDFKKRTGQYRDPAKISDDVLKPSWQDRYASKNSEEGMSTASGTGKAAQNSVESPQRSPTDASPSALNGSPAHPSSSLVQMIVGAIGKIPPMINAAKRKAHMMANAVNRAVQRDSQVEDAASHVANTGFAAKKSPSNLGRYLHAAKMVATGDTGGRTLPHANKMAAAGVIVAKMERAMNPVMTATDQKATAVWQRSKSGAEFRRLKSGKKIYKSKLQQ